MTAIFSLHYEVLLEKPQGHLPLQVHLYLSQTLNHFPCAFLPSRWWQGFKKMLASECGPELAILGAL